MERKNGSKKIVRYIIIKKVVEAAAFFINNLILQKYDILWEVDD
jgi:hypothetical protein